MPTADLTTTTIVGGVVVFIGGAAGWAMLRWLWPRMVNLLVVPVASNIVEYIKIALTESIEQEMSKLLANSIAKVEATLNRRLDERLDRIDGQLNVIQSELTLNGGETVKDRVNATWRMTERIAESLSTAEHDLQDVWATLADHGIDRRGGEDRRHDELDG